MSLYERALALELFRCARGEPFAFVGDWRDDACRVLRIAGTERPAVKKALNKLLNEGLVELSDDGFASVRWCATKLSETRSRSDRGLIETRSRSDRGPGENAAKSAESKGGTDTALKEKNKNREQELDQKGERASADTHEPSDAIPSSTQKMPSSTLVAQVHDMFRAEAFARGYEAPPSLFGSARYAAAQRVIDLAKGGDLEEAARSLLKAAFDDAASTGKSVVITLSDCQPGKPAIPLRAVRPTRHCAAPRDAFSDEDPIAQIERKEAARAAEQARLRAEYGAAHAK